jgi:hypothetical protein
MSAFPTGNPTHPQADIAAAASLNLLPSRGWRVAAALAGVVFFALVFAAWLRPNMVFDLANTIFCG